MNKKTIDNRYTIEYIHPTSSTSISPTQKQSSKGRLLLILLFAFLLIVGFLFKNGNFSNYLRALISTSDKTATSNKNNSNSTAIAITELVAEGSDNNLASDNKEDSEKAVEAKNEESKNVIIFKADKEKIAEVSPDEVIVTKEITTKVDVKKEPALNQTAEKKETFSDDSLNTSFSENDDLINSLDKLTEQLVAERKKNSDLEDKLKENKSTNNNLSTLLANSIKKETTDNKNNKNYLSALQDLEKEKKEEKQQIIEVVSNNKTGNPDSGSDKNTNNDVPYISNNQTAVVTKKIADSKTIAVEINEKTKKNLNYNNAISLSTKSQIDAIILAMKAGGIKTSKPSKPKSNKAESDNLLAKNNDLINQISQQIETDTKGENNDLISVELKGKINQLIVSKELTGSSYKKALNKESKSRSNAVRSIVVKKGETLWGIAKRAYGDGKHYKKILKANPQLARKRKLFLVIGQVIRVPE